MDKQRLRAEQLLTLSGAARRISDLVAASPGALRYEVMRHLVRVSEETMTEVLSEAVGAGLVIRGADPFTYLPATPEIGAEIRDGIGEQRLAHMREQIAGATARVVG